MSAAEKTQKLFKDIEQFIADSHKLLEQGAILELDNLDERVKILCEEVLELSQDDRLKYADELQKLFKDLTALGKTLVEHRDRTAASLQGVSTHQKASSAYRMVDNSDAKTKPEE